MFSKKEQELIDRLRASGRPVYSKQLDAPFRFMVRPLTTVGVPSLELASWCEDAIFKAITGMVFKSSITGIVISPKIFNESVAEPPEDSLTYKGKEKSIFVSLVIDFALWHRASLKQRLNLIIENIKNSISRIPDAYLLRSESNDLLVAIDSACEDLEKSLLS